MTLNHTNSQQQEALAYLFAIRPGPCYSTDEFEPLCRTLSTRFAGEIWVPGNEESDITFGRLRLRVVQEKSSCSSTTNFLNFARKVCRRAEEMRATAIGPKVVISYDPFKSGVLARWVAARLNAPFVCEINGVYGDQNNLAHIHSVVRRSMRFNQMRVVGSWVLSGAQGVKLLFDRQLEGFARPPRESVVRSFFDFCNAERFQSGPEEPIVLSVGFPFWTKGIDVLCSAFLRVAQRFPNWRLVLIGHRIPEEVSLAGFHDSRISVLPGLPQLKLAEWVARCSIFVLASRTEAMGRVLIEAAAAGKSRLASRVGGIPNIIQDGIDGILFEREDVEELAARLEMLMTDMELRRRLGDAARRRAETDFSPESYLNHYCELVESIISASSAAGNKVTV